MKLLPSHIIELQKEIEKIKLERSKTSGTHVTQEDVQLKDHLMGLQQDFEEEMLEWRNYLLKMGINEFSRLCMRINNGKLEILIEKSDGSYILADGTQKLENDVYIFQYSRWNNILAELESLINKENLKEQELQEFFETHPELIMDDKYDFPIPQAVIANDNDIQWRADFILVPKNQLSFAKILELKLPKEKISNREVHGHNRFSSKLYSAINQLRDYQQAFNSEKTKMKFKEKYNTELFKPDLQLFFGSRTSIKSKNSFLELQRRENIEIFDWDTLLENFRRKYK